MSAVAALLCLQCGCAPAPHEPRSASSPPPSTTSSTTSPSQPVLAALPPCAPPPFHGPLFAGQVIGLGRNTLRSPLLDFQPLHMRIGDHLVLNLGVGCNSAATFTISGAAVTITGHDPAPLPGTGDNDVQLTAVAVGSATVHITTNRACSQQGVTKGMCFGSTGALPNVAIVVIEASQADAVRHFMQSDAAFVAKVVGPTNGGHVYCGLHSVGRSPDAAELYEWFFCQEFYDQSGSVARGAGVSAPILLHVAGAGAQTKVVSWQIPRSGSQYGSDVKAMFPPAIARKMLAQDSAAGTSPSEAELTAEAQTDLNNGLL